MSELFLDSLDVIAAFKQVRSKRMAERVTGRPLGETRLANGLLERYLAIADRGSFGRVLHSQRHRECFLRLRSRFLWPISMPPAFFAAGEAFPRKRLPGRCAVVLWFHRVFITFPRGPTTEPLPETIRLRAHELIVIIYCKPNPRPMSSAFFRIRHFF